jgi:hypothetical protein
MFTVEVHRASPYEYQQTAEPTSETWVASEQITFGVAARPVELSVELPPAPDWLEVEAAPEE